MRGVMSVASINPFVLFGSLVLLVVCVSGVAAIRDKRKRESEAKRRVLDSALNAVREIENGNVSGVMDFNQRLGSDLGGVLGVMEVFCDPAGMLKLVVSLYDGIVAMHESGVPMRKAVDCTLDMATQKFPPNYCLALSRYLGFFGGAFSMVRDDPVFCRWIRSASPSVMPDMFTHSLLKVALARVEKEVARP